MKLENLTDKNLCLHVRAKLECSQFDIANVMMMTQPNVSHVETGRQNLKPLARAALITYFHRALKRRNRKVSA